MLLENLVENVVFTRIQLDWAAFGNMCYQYVLSVMTYGAERWSFTEASLESSESLSVL